MTEQIETRVILFPEKIMTVVNKVLPEHLQLSGFVIGSDDTGAIVAVPVDSFIYTLTYSDPTAFDQKMIRSLTITSIVIVDGVLLRENSDGSLTSLGDGIHNLTKNIGQTYILLPDQRFIVELEGETLTVAKAEALIDLSIIPNVTPRMLGAFAAYNISTHTQLSYLTFEQWKSFGGINDYTLFAETIAYCKQAAKDFWENL